MTDLAPTLSPEDALVGWILQRVDPWREWRDNNFSTRWNEYYRMYRGLWTDADKTRSSERSRIMGTELAQAIETSVAEIEDALFSRERWVDIIDDELDPNRQDVAAALGLLLDEYDRYNVKASISEIILNGALYGTGIGKIVVDKVEIPTVDTSSGLPAATYSTQYCVKLVPISPRNFIIDPHANSIEEAMGCAHETKIPRSVVLERQEKGYYRKFELDSYDDHVDDLTALGEIAAATGAAEGCKVVEWHGLVPKKLLNKKEELFDDLELALNTESREIHDDRDDGALIEAIVTIVNDTHVARAVVNPFLFNDRSVIAFPYDKIPNRFWGRGISEKGYNPQKALDAELRARIDALAFSTAPMMAMDSTKIPRGEKFAVTPGKNILTIGNPAESLMPLKFPPPDPYTFNQTQELREMLQRGTGSYELPANVDNSRMAATSMSMIVGSMIKRSRRILGNIERHLLTPLVSKSLWRYMQFAPERFPMQDYRFKVKTAMGIMAREFEQGQYVSLLSTVPAESPAFWMLMKGVYANSNIDERESMLDYCDQMLQQAMNPQPPPPDPMVEIKMRELAYLERRWQDERDLKTRELMQKDEMIRAEALRDIGEGRMQDSTAVLQLVKAETEQLKVQSDAVLALAKAESERSKAELDAYKAALEELRIRIDVGKQMSAAPPVTTEAQPAIEEVPVELPEIKDEAEISTKEDLLSPMIERLIGLMESQVTDMEGTDVSENAEIRAFKQSGRDDVINNINRTIEVLNQKIDALAQTQQAAPAATPGEVSIERDENGQVRAVNGRPIKRDEQGLISGVE